MIAFHVPVYSCLLKRDVHWWQDHDRTMFALNLYVFLCVLREIATEVTIDLNGAWLTRAAKKGFLFARIFSPCSYQVWFKGSQRYDAKVPGNIYTDLLRNGTLNGDPYYRYNDEEFRWVSKEDWMYWRTFKGNSNECVRVARGKMLEIYALRTPPSWCGTRECCETIWNLKQSASIQHLLVFHVIFC